MEDKETPDKTKLRYFDAKLTAREFQFPVNLKLLNNYSTIYVSSRYLVVAVIVCYPLPQVITQPNLCLFYPNNIKATP